MKWIQKLMTVLLSLNLMFISIIICLLSSLPHFFAPSTYISVMEEANVYQSIQENIQNSVDDVMLLNNIERQSMSEFVTLEEVKEVVIADVYAVLAWLNGTGQKVGALDLSRYEERFDERMATFFRDHHYYLDDSSKREVELMKQNVLQVIEGNLRLLNFDELTNINGLQTLTALVNEMNLKVITLTLSGVALLMVLVLVLLSPKSRARNRRKKVELGLLWSGYGLMAGGLIIFILFFSGIQSGFYHHMAIQVRYLRESLSLLIENWFKILVNFGLMMTALGVLLMIPYWVKLYKKCMA